MAVPMVYKNPSYVTRAAKQKFGRGIKIMGITDDEELRLWKQISLRAISTGKPEKKSVTVVDVKTMSFTNRSLAAINAEGKEKESAEEGCNEVEIGSKSRSNEPSQKTYQIQLGDWSHGEIGQFIKTKLGEGNFYNSIAAPVTFEAGEFTKGKEDEDVPLDIKDYHVKERFTVPPKTKVTATLLTKSVTHEVSTVTELRVNADTRLGVRFKGRIEKKLGSLCTATIRCLTAEDLFRNEAGYKVVDGVVTFTREGTITYTGEEVEIITDMEEV